MGRRFWSAFLVGCFALLVLVTNGINSRISERSAPFLPIVHPNGEKEFRLINAGDDGRDRTSDDEIWVLKMPDGLWAQSRDEGRTEKQIAQNPDYPYNLNFSFVLALPQLEFLPEPFQEVRYDRAMITVHADHEPYGSGGFEGTLEYTFSVKQDLRANYNCRPDRFVGPGVYALRSTTEAEATEMVQQYKDQIQPSVLRWFSPPECNRPLSGALHQEYAIYDKQGRGVGFGSCVSIKGSDPKIGPRGTCDFRFWLPNERVFSVGLRSEYAPIAQSLYLRVVDILKDATDAAASKNVVDW